MARSFRSASLAAACFAAALAGACQAPLTLPDSFVELADAGSGYRAVTSDDARLWVRELHESTEADVEFWAENLRRDFVEQRGHELVAEGEIDNAAGQTGRWLELQATIAGEPTGYLIAVWVDGTTVQVVEFGARREVFDARVDAVREALRTVR